MLLYLSALGGTVDNPGGGVVFVADKLFISTRLGGALKISNINKCLGPLIIYLKNTPVLPLEIEWWPPYGIRQKTKLLGRKRMSKLKIINLLLIFIYKSSLVSE